MLSDITAVFSAITFDELVLLIQEHQYLLAILVPFWSGEYGVHIFGILNGSGDVSLTLTIVATASMLTLDMLVYGVVRLLQRSVAVTHFFQKSKVAMWCDRFFRRYEKRFRKYPTLLLIALKLMPMTKVSIIFFVIYQRVSITWFIVRDVIVTVVWVIILFLPGWFVGRELLTQGAGRRISVFIIYFLLLGVMMFLFSEKVNTLIIKVMGKIADMLDAAKRKKHSDG